MKKIESWTKKKGRRSNYEGQPFTFSIITKIFPNSTQYLEETLIQLLIPIAEGLNDLFTSNQANELAFNSPQMTPRATSRLLTNVLLKTNLSPANINSSFNEKIETNNTYKPLDIHGRTEYSLILSS